MTRFLLRIHRLTRSMVFRLIAFSVVLLLLGTVGRIVFVTVSLREGIEGLVSSQLQSLAEYVANDVNDKVNDRRQLLAVVSGDLPADKLTHSDELTAVLARQHAVAPLFSQGMLLVPLTGHGVLADFPTVPTRKQQDFSQTGWFQAARQGTPFFVGAPAAEGVMPRNSVVMALPVFGPGSRVVAVLAGISSIDAPGFLNQIQRQGIGHTGGFLLVSPSDKRFVAASIPQLRQQPLPKPGVNALHDQAMAGWRGTGVTVNAFGVEELVAVASVASADWFVVARLPTAEAFEPVWAIRHLIVRNAVGLSIVIVLLLALILTLIVRPLKDVARQMRKMADGDMPLAPLAVVRQDEVGEMVESFNHLVARLQESENRLTHMAHHDPLTGLPNRRALLDRARQGMALAQRQGSRLALLFVDIDGFKPVNDQLGHEAGDLLLQALASRLRQTVRQADVVARLGGDEFVVLLTDVPDRERVAAVAAKLIDVLSQPCIVRDQAVSVGASIGIAMYPGDASEVDALMTCADQAMYEAKRGGRSTYRFAD